MSQKLDKFTSRLIQEGRDKTLSSWDRIVSGELHLPKFQKYQDTIDSLSDVQRSMLLELGRHLVDGCLHNVLFLFETSESYFIAIKTDDGEPENLKDLLGDPLQGFLFDWIEENSDK